jgi:hypothetical protein
MTRNQSAAPIAPQRAAQGHSCALVIILVLGCLLALAKGAL